MKIVVFGGAGQLGHEIRSRAEDLNFEVAAPVTSEVNISEAEQVRYLMRQLKPSIVINCAAYTAVDKAEEERDAAMQINCAGAANVAEAAREIGARMIQLSTDYVFDGDFETPIGEDAPTHPISVYGETKLAGEQRVMEILGSQGLIVRTSSLHGRHGMNFVHTMLDLFAKRECVKVVADQYMSPTYAGWLAEVVLDLGRIECSGPVHAACAGAISWYEFAVEIEKLSRGKTARAPGFRLERTTAAEFARPAKRPRYSVFDCSRLTKLLGRPPIPWQDGLRQHLSEIGALA